MPTYITVSTATAYPWVNCVKAGAGTLWRVVVTSSTGSGVVTLVDGLTTSAPATVMANLKAQITAQTYEYGCNFQRGLVISVSATDNVTVVFD